MTSSEQPIDAFVIKVKHDYLVRPATAIVRGKRAWLRNLTGSDIVVFFPVGAAEKVTAIKAGAAVPVDFSITSAGVFSYAVHVAEANAFATGESDPRMIVDP